VQALAEIKRAELDDLPYGVRGEMAAQRPAEPPPAPPQPLVIEPPPWAGRESEPPEPMPMPDREPSHAAMFGGFAAYDPPEPALGPPLHLPPLTRLTFPAPDWEAEEQERARQAAAAKRKAELEREHERYPAKKVNRTWRTS
jgi:hypothetical protein